MSADLFDVPDNTENVSDEILEQMQVLDQVIRSTFSTRNGKKTLEHMRKIAMQPGFDANMGLFNGIANGFAREGQTALIAYIERRMTRANNLTG